jgi:hypothetical protein
VGGKMTVFGNELITCIHSPSVHQPLESPLLQLPVETPAQSTQDARESLELALKPLRRQSSNKGQCWRLRCPWP